MKNKAGLIALGVLAVAVVTMVFGILPNINTPKETVPAAADTKLDAANTTPAGDTVAADGKTARTPETDQAKIKAEAEKAAATTTQADAKPDDDNKTEVAAIDQKATDPTADWVIPAFDVLRVEPDGSTVIAGRAQPNTKLEIVNGDQVLITTDVGPAGDFAAIFDKPLGAGDYQLTLRSVGKDGLTKASQEVATISVPKDGSGELLAMVSKPGEASRVITVPEAKKTADVAKTVGQPATDTASATETAAKATAETVKTETALAKPADTAIAGAAPAETKIDGTTPDVSASSPEIRVSAVEIEGEKLFVAGAARPGALVRIYADDKLVGEIKADAEGRFVVDGKMPLTVGRHTIRADMLNADGSKVEFRAAVPFDRPEGNQVAVVADNSVGASATDAAGDLALLGGGVFDKQRTEAAKALALLKGLFEGGKIPTAEQLAAARSATEIALGSLAEFKLPDGADAGVAEMAAKTAKGAADALAMLKAVPQDAASVAASLGKIETAVNAALTPQGGAMANTSIAAANTPADSLFDQQRAQASQSLDRLKSLFNDGKVPAPADLSAARSSTEVALNALAALKLPDSADAAATDMAAKASKGAADALALLKAVPNDAASVSAALGKIDTAVSMALAPKGGDMASGQTQQQADAAATPQTAAGMSDVPAETASEPKTVEQAPLKQSKTSVIIRRGDTLWQISRRVYGAGVRYTTIYLANEDQISNPDRILPGQVFGVPDSALPDADAQEMHRKRLKAE